ncbi:WD repeat-containing protein 18 [Halotydeus destructor]|nr:WD repeat-containing protein 18 [Halotydeus destructor]
MASKQVVISTDLNGQLWSACIFDLFSGTTLSSFKGASACKPRTLALIRDDYLVAAENDKSVLYFWSLKEKQSDKHLKIVCPGRITALTITPDGGYCVVAIAERLYIWQMSTGNLITTLERHYQTINVIKTSTDGSFLITGGDDGLVLAWFLPRLLSSSRGHSGDASDILTESNEPKFTWTLHSAKVTDLAVGHGGVCGRVASVSLDKTCRVHELITGNHLFTLVYDTPLWSVALDPAQYFLFVGDENGNIYQTKLFEKRSQINARPNERNPPTYIGHKGRVTCLSVSVDGNALVSGSHDQTVKVWNVTGKNCIRSIDHKGPIGNALIIPTPQGLTSESCKPSEVTIKPFKRNDASSGISQDIRLKLTSLSSQSRVLKENWTGDMSSESNSEQIKQLETTINELHCVNRNVYSFALDEVFGVVTEANK